MTLYLLFEFLESGRVQLHERIKVDEDAWRAPGSRMFLKLNSEVRVDDLIAGLVLYNANDATVALVKRLAPSLEEFVVQMNQRAEMMQLHNTTYTHPAGLADPDSSTTACEQLLMMRYLRHRFPEHLHYFSMPYHSFQGSVRSNPNGLLTSARGVNGMIAVQTNERRHHIAVSSTRRGLALNFVLLGAGSSRTSQLMSTSIIDHFYHHYQSVRVFGPRESLRTVDIWHGEQEQLGLGSLEAVSVVLPYGQEDKIDIYILVPDAIEAPVRAGQRLGSIRISHGEKELANEPLVALQSIERANWMSRLWDNLRRLFR